MNSKALISLYHRMKLKRRQILQRSIQGLILEKQVTDSNLNCVWKIQRQTENFLMIS